MEVIVRITLWLLAKIQLEFSLIFGLKAQIGIGVVPLDFICLGFWPLASVGVYLRRECH